MMNYSSIFFAFNFHLQVEVARFGLRLRLLLSEICVVWNCLDELSGQLAVYVAHIAIGAGRRCSHVVVGIGMIVAIHYNWQLHCYNTFELVFIADLTRDWVGYRIILQVLRFNFKVFYFEFNFQEVFEPIDFERLQYS